MRANAIFPVLGIMLVVSGVSLYQVMTPGGLKPASHSSSIGAGNADSLPYNCGLPAINTQYSCDKVPQGYQAAPHLSNAPPAYCASGMTASACSLLKTTYANGICDPNETVWTDPLDCGCTGELTGDPYTGRCNSAATICQVGGGAPPVKAQAG
ncbi:MAG TPA: hypothetical protein VGR53_01560 [Nitrososphaerales archaeon]|nr:hypothetical protein [Nitrososphaerales archaeon]